MKAPNPARLDIDALVEFIDDCVGYFEFPGPVAVRAERSVEFRMLFGICAEITRLARGRKVLAEAGLRIEARILVRSALEYAATAQYSYFRAGGIERLAKSAAVEQRELYSRLAEWTGIEGYLKLRDRIEVPDYPKCLPKVSQINDILDPGKVVFQHAYKVLSQTTHVTSESLSQYFQVNPDDRDEWWLNHYASDDRFEKLTVFSLAMSTMTATWIMADIFGDTTTRGALDDRSDELGIPIRFDEDWAPAERSRPA